MTILPRLVMICQDSIRPNNPIWRRKFDQLQSKATVIASVGVEGNIYAKQGTTVDTRITVIDKIPAASPRQFIETMPCMNLTDLSQIIAQVPPRSKQLKIAALAAPIVEQESLFDLSSVPKTTNIIPFPRTAITVPKVEVEAKTEAKVNWSEVEPVKYIQNHWNKELSQPQGLFAPYQIEGIKLSGCQSHPTDAVESIAMASIQSPSCSYQPLLPKQIIEQGILSDIQLETIIRAGEAHSKLLNKWVKIDENNKVRHYPYAEPDARQERQGYLCGDGTGIGKGRQIAGVILDNWLQGKTKAVWLSISPNLIEDARRDWQDLGGKSEQIICQSSFKPNQRIALNEGILFTTYRTLARPETTKNQSRLEQIIDWLGEDFAGIIAFDECHAMAGALPTKGTRGTQKASLQGLAGLRIQHQLPNARIMYVSATGASKIQNLAYAERLGLWGTQNSAFSDRQVFIEKIGNSGIAAMEIISRELKAQGLYLARSLSYQGIEYQTLEHKLTPEQVEIYNQYAKAFEIIHNNISEALSCTCTNEESSLTSAQGTAYSAFESIKQRFSISY
ncbi:MAG: DEAD/DEAH box helicase family protein [Pleurocapsa sp. CRU_1_2]|nr:DEAD/DEAH box helicase family protein [Pleurocapsa sp. CRU_1_2]